jgi:hypothetical protein
MNEPANQVDEKFSCPHNKYDFPEFRISRSFSKIKLKIYKLLSYLEDNYVNGVKNLSYKTLCMVATQGENNEFMEYDVHSLYGLSEMIATQKYDLNQDV